MTTLTTEWTLLEERRRLVSGRHRSGRLRAAAAGFATAVCLICTAGTMADTPVGFAAVTGDGLSTTTGGGSATPVTVTTFSELSAAVSGSTPRVIIVSGTIRTTDGGGYALQIGANKTIRGVNASATIYGGIDISGVSNVIIQDLNFHGIYPNSGPDDAIAVHNSHHVWLDHLSIWDAGDGNLDITDRSSYITVSWCRFYYTDASNSHRLCCLIGSGGGDHPEDWGRLKVTYHHNWFADLVSSRMPRLVYGQAHAYNNYYTSSGNGYCIGVGSYGSMLVENNYFKNVNDPHTFMYDVWCYIVARGNTYDNCSGATDTGLGGSRDVAGQESFDVAPFDTPPYSYTPDNAADVPSIVSSGVGPFSQGANDPPVVSITSPSSGALFAAPASITINANASDSDGTISSVEFFQGSSSLGTDTTWPYSVTWSGVTVGNYSLTAVATDDDGFQSVSLPVSITVVDPGTPSPLQAEDAAYGGGVTMDSDNTGWNGTGYANFPSSGGYVQFNNVDGGTGGPATLDIRFAVGGTSSRTGNLGVNGAIQPITFPPTIDWKIWTNLSVVITLGAGETNVIRFESTGQDLANMDEIAVTPTVAANTAPLLAAISNHAINVGVSLLITNSATDSDTPAQTLTYNLISAVTNATINSNNGVFNWHPMVAQSNTTNSFSVVVSDDGSPSLSATQSFGVVVNPLVLPSLALLQMTNGQIGLSMNGQVGPDYAVQASTNLVDWTTLLITNPPSMPFSWSTNASAAPAQFYRIQVGPPLP